MKIPATIGMLTYNSERHLARALESVQDFAEIIIADGGSTDGTRAIAERYGARVISQSASGQPIRDFARERNATLTEATQPWYFYLDSDESMSFELVQHIRRISEEPGHPFNAYRVRYLKTSHDLSKKYRTFREYYQLRLVRTDVGARFERPIHERIVVPPFVRIGQTEAPWYVPLEEKDLSFRVFAAKAWQRTRVEADMWCPQSVIDAFVAIVGGPAVRIGKSLIKMSFVKIRFGRDAIPLRYELLRILYTGMLSLQNLRRLFRRRRPEAHV